MALTLEGKESLDKAFNMLKDEHNDSESEVTGFLIHRLKEKWEYIILRVENKILTNEKKKNKKITVLSLYESINLSKTTKLRIKDYIKHGGYEEIIFGILFKNIVIWREDIASICSFGEHLLDELKDLEIYIMFGKIMEKKMNIFTRDGNRIEDDDNIDVIISDCVCNPNLFVNQSQDLVEKKGNNSLGLRAYKPVTPKAKRDAKQQQPKKNKNNNKNEDKKKKRPKRRGRKKKKSSKRKREATSSEEENQKDKETKPPPKKIRKLEKKQGASWFSKLQSQKVLVKKKKKNKNQNQSISKLTTNSSSLRKRFRKTGWKK